MKSQKPITTKENQYGNTDALVSRHPAFGMIRVSRINGEQRLFGSEVENAGHISIEVKRGEEVWSLHEKSYSANGPLCLRVAMSYAQFAEAICNQICGEGIPCTLEYVNGEYVSAISQNTVSVSEQIKLDIKEYTKKINDPLDMLEGQIHGLKISEKQKELLIETLEVSRRELNSNLPFVISQCEEAVEHITTKSKIEVEAFAQGRIRDLGMQALAEKQLFKLRGE